MFAASFMLPYNHGAGLEIVNVSKGKQAGPTGRQSEAACRAVDWRGAGEVESVAVCNLGR